MTDKRDDGGRRVGRGPWRPRLSLLRSGRFGILFALLLPLPLASTPLHWVRQTPSPALEGWRLNFARGLRGELYLGGVSPGNTLGGRGAVLTLGPGGRWHPLPGAPEFGRRTYALDVDPAGGLWVASYWNALDPAERRVKVHHLAAGRWTEEPVSGTFWPQALAMASPTEGWMAGNGGRFRVRRAGGWEEVLLEGWAGERPPDILDLAVTGPDDGWAVGNHGLVARLEGGRWRAQPSPLPEAEIYSVAVSSVGTVYLGGAGGALFARRGERWERIETGLQENLFDLALTGPEQGWAIGQDGTLIRFDGKQVEQFDVATQPTVAVSFLGDAVYVAGSGFVAAARTASRWLGFPAGDSPLRLPAVAARGLTADDLDGDGDVDLFFNTPARPRLFARDGRAGFRAVRLPEEGVAGTGWEAAAWGDADGDGDLDLAFVTGNPGRLLLALTHGGLRFAAPRPLPHPGPFGGSPSLLWLDADGDGHLDLYAVRDVGEGPSTLGNLLFLGDGAGSFELASADTGLRGVDPFGVAGDFDGDLDPDLLLPGTGTETHVVRNEAGTLVTPPAGDWLGRGDGSLVLQGLAADIDRDGDLDLGLLGDRLQLLENDGHGRFVATTRPVPEVTRGNSDSHLACAAGDLDLDGRPELLWLASTSERNAFVLLAPDSGGWRDRTTEAGLDGIAAEAATFADLDGDLDLDLVVADETTPAVFENRLDPPHGLAVTLAGARSNRRAVGAQVRLWRLDDRGLRAELLGHQVAGLGASTAGQPPTGSLLFARPAGQPVEVEVSFRSGRRVVRRVEAAVRRIQIAELPALPRLFDRGFQALRRTVLAAEPAADLGYVAFVLGLLTGLRGRLGGRLGLATLLSRPGVLTTLAVLALGLRVAEGTTPDRIAALAVWLGVLAPVALVDLRLTAWRHARHVGPYRLLETLGEGGMGVVYRARHVVSGRSVALKLPHPRLLPDEPSRRRFLREAAALGRLDHPNIVRVLESGDVGGRAYIALELLSGSSLAEFLARGERLSSPAATALLEVAAEVLDAVHRAGLIHRDVKPSNLFLLGAEPLPASVAEWRSRLRLMDFGLAHGSGGTTSLAAGVAGTPAYLAPEQLLGGPVDARVDLYALGLVVRETLDEAPVDAALARLLGRLTAQRPDERPSSGAAVLAELHGEAPAPPDDSRGAPDSPWQEDVRRARAELATGRPTAAHVAALAALARLRRELETPTLRHEQRELEQAVATVLDLVARTGRGA